MSTRPASVRRRATGLGALALSVATLAASAGAAPAAPGVPAEGAEQGYPRHADLAVSPVDPADASTRLGLTAYHEIAPRLLELQERSDRVSTEVLATSAGGRQVVMVTLTLPESAAEARRQAQMRERVRTRPTQAAGDGGLARDYKLPVLVNANIHGNEWEGTDAVLRFVEEWATSDAPNIVHTLGTTRLHLVVSLNPDGRHDNTRRNASGFDMNRDFLTATQPEVVGLRDAIVRLQPAMMIDLHGYVNGTLVEPTTPPHGENYEYDLFVRHAYPNALGIEEKILALDHGEKDGVRPPQIPLRDWAEGWDDWPPIFTPQYAAFHGAVSHTVEIPLRVNNGEYTGQDELELQRRARINTDIAHAAILATVEYAATSRPQLLADQIEVFRRGVTGEAQHPVEQGLFGLIGPEDVYLTDFPRAYVIPTGEGQRSERAAARLVDHLVDNGVEVRRLSRPATIEGRSWPVGTYVVDMHQARRGMANTLLATGTDISDRVDTMYDISGWSPALLWGADVVPVPEKGQPLTIVSRLVEGATPTGRLADAGTGWLVELEDPEDVAAVNAMLAGGAALELLEDGTVLVPGSAGAQARQAVAEHGTVLAAAPAGATGSPLEPLRVGAAATPEERWALGEMGWTVEPVSTSALNDGLQLDHLDALYVSSDLAWRQLDEEARAELRSFVADGGALVGRGKTGAALNGALELLDVTSTAGRSDANGVVSVDSADTVLAHGATEHTFVYAPLWFTVADDGRIVVDQRFTEDPLVSGHWRADGNGHGGPEQAAGQAVVLHGEAGGGRVALLGSEPLFRAHPKGQYPIVARALLWGGAQG